jgi:hypothetical protein
MIQRFIPFIIVYLGVTMKINKFAVMSNLG